MLVKKYLSGIAFFLTLSFYSVPLEAVIDTGVTRLSFKTVTGSFIESNKTGQLFVIRGQVANNYGTTRRFILLEANILDDKGHVVTSKSVYAGNAFTESEIKGMSLEEIDDASTNPYVKGNVNVSIRPGGVVPFVIIFKNLPENLSEFTVQAISSSPGEISADQGKTTAEEEIEKKIRRIAEQFEEASQREIPEQIRIKGGRLNVRSGPGTTYPVVCTVKLNNIFVAQEKARGWIRIQVDSNTAGWVFEKYVEYLSPDTKSGQVQEPKSESPSTTQETSVVKPAPTGAPETVAPVTTMSRPIFASAAKKLLLITLIVSIFAFSIINRKLGLKHWWILLLISLMVLAIFLPGILADLHYELDESMKLLLVLGCLIGAIAIAYISESRWTFVLLLFGGLPLLMLAHKILGVWIGTILLFLIIWVYGLFIRKLDGKTKPKKASIGIIKYIPITIVGLSYIVVAGAKLVQILMGNHFNPYLIVPETLWLLLGIAIIYQKKAAIILSLVSYPLVFGTENLPQFFNLIKDINFITPFFYTPFHYISFIILQKYALLSIVKPYWIFYLWGIYAIHFASLFPYLFKFKKRGRVGKPKPAIRFPEEVFMYEKNAFQVLGLIPYKANKIRAILKRKDDLSNLIKIGLKPQEHIKENYHVIPWPKAQPIAEFTINNAYSRLEDSLKRIKEELFWFHLEENNLKVFECLKRGDFEEGKRLWEDRKKNSRTYRGALSLHNLAVLEHALVLNEERAITGNPGMNSEQINKWKRVFALWVEVYKHDKCWDYFRQRMVYLNDTRINDGYLRRLRRDMPGMVLKVNLEIARAALSQEMFEYTKKHLDLIGSSGFDSKNINKVVEEFFAIFVRDLKAIRQRIESLPNDRERDELYGKYTRALERAVNVKERVDRLEGCSYIEEEIKKFISIPAKQIKKDLNTAIGKVITIRDEISNYANFLIEEWNNEFGSSLSIQSLFLARAIKEKFEENAGRIDEIKDAVSEAVDITKEGKKILKRIEKLCCDDESRRNIMNDLNWLDEQKGEFNRVVSTLEEWLDRNLATLSSQI